MYMGMVVLSIQWHEWKQTLWKALQIRPKAYHLMDTTPQGDSKWKGTTKSIYVRGINRIWISTLPHELQVMHS